MGDFFQAIYDNHPLMIVLLTLAPALELRASIPYGVWVAKENWILVFVIAVVTNIVLGPILYFLMDKFMHVLLRIGWVQRLWNRMIAKTQKKIHPLVHKYGIWGLGIFIGVPLPGSGVYSGAIGAYLLGFTKKEFYLATVVGVLIAGIVVTAVVLSGSGLAAWFVKKV